MSTAETRVRPAAVAGRFYPADPGVLAADIDDLVRDAFEAEDPGSLPPKAIVVPHAGYQYSGSIAATAYAMLRAAKGSVERVVLLGPAHFVRVDGLATVSVDALETPLGPIAVDDDARRAVLTVAGVSVDDSAHAPEHSLEVHLPFLLRVLGDVRVLPLVVGRAEPATIADALDAVWGGPETLIVVSSDLSHYLDHATATSRDRETAAAIVGGDVDAIGSHDACGATGVRGLLVAACRRGLHAHLVDLRNSGDTAGSRDRVVGYGAFTFTVAQPRTPLDAGQRDRLLEIAVDAVRSRLAGGDDAIPKVVDLADPALTVAAASFVTLQRDGALLGCIGSLAADEPLAVGVAKHALGAAFSDPRLPAVTTDDYTAMSVKVSVLSDLEPMTVESFDELVPAVRPGIDGLLVTAGSRRATLLPSVWEDLPNPARFLDALWAKAGLARGAWPPGLTVARYETEEFGDPGPRMLAE